MLVSFRMRLYVVKISKPSERPKSVTTGNVQRVQNVVRMPTAVLMPPRDVAAAALHRLLETTETIPETMRPIRRLELRLNVILSGVRNPPITH